MVFLGPVERAAIDWMKTWPSCAALLFTALRKTGVHVVHVATFQMRLLSVYSLLACKRYSETNVLLDTDTTMYQHIPDVHHSAMIVSFIDRLHFPTVLQRDARQQLGKREGC